MKEWKPGMIAKYDRDGQLALLIEFDKNDLKYPGKVWICYLLTDSEYDSWKRGDIRGVKIDHNWSVYNVKN